MREALGCHKTARGHHNVPCNISTVADEGLDLHSHFHCLDAVAAPVMAAEIAF
jgi:hypothetical protein